MKKKKSEILDKYNLEICFKFTYSLEQLLCACLSSDPVPFGSEWKHNEGFLWN